MAMVNGSTRFESDFSALLSDAPAPVAVLSYKKSFVKKTMIEKSLGTNGKIGRENEGGFSGTGRVEILNSHNSLALDEFLGIAIKTKGGEGASDGGPFWMIFQSLSKGASPCWGGDTVGVEEEAKGLGVVFESVAQAVVSGGSRARPRLVEKDALGGGGLPVEEG
jgi:hypothetical protein